MLVERRLFACCLFPLQLPQFLRLKSLYESGVIQRKPEVEPYDLVDDFGKIAEAAVELWICHPASLQNLMTDGKLTVPKRNVRP